MNYKHLLLYVYLLVSMLIVVACANRGVGPQGGPKDETPPVILKELPENGSVNYKDKVITLQFDEYVQLNDVANQVLISPPQQRPPLVKAVGKKVTVTFDEDLRDSTTYTIDFGSSIVDNNEKNPLDNYVFSFSTGPEIDTLQMEGVLINSEDLNPMSGIYVGIHSNLSDTALATLPFAHISRTDANGHFVIRNVHPGTYRIYALNDVSKDFLYQPGEGLAFLDTLFVPVAIDSLIMPETDSLVNDSVDALLASDSLLRNDTLFVADGFYINEEYHFTGKEIAARMKGIAPDSLANDSLLIDSVSLPRIVTFYEPSGIVLRYFTEDKQRHYFVRCLREEQNHFQLLFSAPQDSMPYFSYLQPSELDSIHTADSLQVSVPDTSTITDSVSADSVVVEARPEFHLTADNLPDSVFIIQSSLHRDTITFWMRDSSYIMQDTLAFVMTYMYTDSLYNLVPKTDTIRAVYRAPKLSEKAKEALARSKANKKEVLDIRTNAANAFDIYNPLTITCKTPVESWHRDSLHLFEMVDTVRKAIPLQIEPTDSSGMVFHIKHDWKAATSYVLTIDSAAFTDIYGLSSNKQEVKWTIRSLDEYSTLTIKVEPFSSAMMIQIISEKDQPVRTMRATEDGAKFEYLKPQSYFVRIYEDLNGDSVWTTGDWGKKRQPEPVFYFPNKLTLRANWEFEETVRYLDKDILEQKPQEIKKDGNVKKK